MLVWHYTWGHKWPYIQRDGLILLADGKLGPRERPAVWFSTREDFEPTAVKRYGVDRYGDWHEVTFEQALELCNGAYRIGVDRDELKLISWLEYLKTSNVSREDAKTMRVNAIKWKAAPSDWWASYRPVPRRYWRAVEKRSEDGSWHSIDVKSISTEAIRC
jgi:hypothetical protein